MTLQPSERIKSEAFKLKLEKEATNSSLCLLLEEEKTISQIDLTLKFKSDPDFEARETELQNKLGKHQAYIKERKHNLLVRDSLDFKEGRAYAVSSRSSRKGVRISDF